MPTTGELLVASLRAAGARASFGPVALRGLDHVDVADAALAALLADADGRVAPGVGVAWDGRQLRMSSRPGGQATPVVLDDERRITATMEPATRAVRRAAATRAVDVELDLEAALVPRARPRAIVDYEPFAGPVVPRDRATNAAMLVGPGVVRRGAVDGLREFAGAAKLPVANTWGAKGVFAWDSPHHMGTCGLQADDLRLLGLDRVDLLVTSGLDADEAPRGALRSLGVRVVDVAPEQLGALAALNERDGVVDASGNEMYVRLAAIAQPGYRDDRFPLHPARAVAQLGAARPAGGIVAADPGRAGLWVARAFPTVELGSVVVPATRAAGAAAALALCARRLGRAAAAVVEHEVDAATAAVVELADRLGLGFPLYVWGAPRSDIHSVDDHEGACGRFAAGATMRHVERVDVPVDWSPTDALVDAAGPVVAWQAHVA